MAGFLRHLSALSRKNYINWKRTWLGSLLEIVFPILCMYMVTIPYNMSDQINKEEQSYLDLAYAQYPVTHPIGIRWVPTHTQPDDLLEFLNFANITQQPENFQQRFPGMFWPSQCYGYGASNPQFTNLFPDEEESQSLAPRRNMTAIGYIAANNQIERDVLSQLHLIFRKQQLTYPGIYHNYQFIKFNTLKEVQEYVRHPEYSYDLDRPGLCFAFWIKKLSDTRYDISLMFNDQFEDDFQSAGVPKQTESVWDPIKPQANVKAFYKYMNSGYAIMQNLIANTILRYNTNETASIAMITVPQNQQPYSTDPLIEQVLIQWLPVATLVAYLFPVFRISQRMVAEKEIQVRDSMRMMGLNEIAYWASWLLYYCIINVIVASMCTLMLFQTLFKHSDSFLVWLFFFMYGLSLFGFVTFVQAFFHNARYAAVFSAILYGSLYTVNLMVQSAEVKEQGKNYASLIPQVALSLMVPHLGAFEAAGIGLNFQNAQQAYKNYTFTTGYWILLLDFIVYTMIGIYLDNVMPRESGMQKPFSFGFSYLKASYWDFFDLCQCKKRNSQRKYAYLRDAAKRRAELEDHDFLTFETKYMRQENFEAPDIQLQGLEKKRRFLKLLDLTKQYNNGYKAVDGINLRMYEGQIFALLGHNGAGKTTTIQMMTGMLEPTEGEAFVYGYRVFSQGDMDTLRRYMGVCPQHNVLFDLLTPQETIRVFQSFKGAAGSRKEKNAEVEKILKDVGLWEYRKTRGKNLSGGNKRKLSVAIALCGQSKFVMLDEPTAGMDLQARRNLWNMLRAYRNDRIIVLTTHYMDEADVLGDRIGIMQNGRLVTVGSSLFLKKRYGVGYNFTFEKLKPKLQEQLQDNEDQNEPVMPKVFDLNKLDDYLKNELSESIKMLSHVGDEITYQVPTECAASFKNFFLEFDQKLEELMIQGYGISVTSLEEVFLRVGQQDEEIPINKDVQQKSSEQLQKVREAEQDRALAEFSIAEKKTYFSFCQNLRAMCYKRDRLDRRRWRTVLISECLTPVLFILVGILITQLQFFYDSPARRLETKMFPLPQRLLMNQEPVLNSTLETNTTYQDYISIPPLVENFPSSYTLLTDEDFEVTFTNYTDEYILGERSRANGVSAANTFNLFESFNEDLYTMRLFGDREPYRYGSYLVYQADPDLKQYKVINYVNTTSQDVAAAYPQFMYESILRSATNESNFQFRTTTMPFPISQRYRDQEKKTSAVSLIFVIAVGLSLIPANIVGSILRERERNLKHLQLISGLNLVAYHLVNIYFDVVKTVAIVAVSGSLFFMWQLQDFYWAYLIMLLWPFAAVPATHTIAFFFKTEWSAQFAAIAFNLLVLGALPITVSQLMFSEATMELAENMNDGFLYLPGYSLGRALLFCGYQEQYIRFRKSLGEDFEREVWSEGNFDSNISATFIHWGVCIFLVLMLDNVLGLPNCWKFAQRLYERAVFRFNACFLRSGFVSIPEFEDDDVRNEEARVKRLTKHDMQVRVSNYSKIYTSGTSRTLAVRNASFGLQFGECFALLGVNGAGKTTTFKSLTNEVHPSGGEVSIGGYDITRQFSKARKMIGFCPQENVLFTELTVEEHINFYALLKGIPGSIRKKLIEGTIREMDLQDQRRKKSSALSGGNKRKLQVAIAIVGNPPIILLDEPSAGMDPQARRFMWSVIAQLNKKREKCAVILTTHSMEEAEALGSKLGIMVKGGQFRCYGSAQHIKNKFGTGFEVEIKIAPLQFEGIQKLQQLFGIQDTTTKMPLKQAVKKMRESNFPEELLEEIRDTGLGDELMRESKFDAAGNIRVRHLIEWVHNMRHGMRVVRSFAKDFGQVTLLEQYSDYFKIRIQMHDKSIGHVFGHIEEQKEFFGIAEYSVTQTTLEQIFQMFANSKRADVDDIDELDKITFAYTPPNEKSLFELIITKNRH